MLLDKRSCNRFVIVTNPTRHLFLGNDDRRVYPGIATRTVYPEQVHRYARLICRTGDPGTGYLDGIDYMYITNGFPPFIVSPDPAGGIGTMKIATGLPRFVVK